MTYFSWQDVMLISRRRRSDFPPATKRIQAQIQSGYYSTFIWIEALNLAVLCSNPIDGCFINKYNDWSFNFYLLLSMIFLFLLG